MSLLYLDPFAGIAGDMFLGLMLDLGVSVMDLENNLDKLGIHYQLNITRVNKNGITATNVEPRFDDSTGERLSYEQIQGHLNNLDEPVKSRAKMIFEKLTKAECQVHGVPQEEVHFHELGGLDAILEIVGAISGLEILGVDGIYCNLVNLGSGYINIEHGRFPVPAPATAELLKGASVILGSQEVTSELVTPTGAVLLNELVDKFGEAKFRIDKIGYGAGDKSLKIPNVLRGFLGSKLGQESRENEAGDYHFAEINVTKTEFMENKKGSSKLRYSPIGVLDTPYRSRAPYQSLTKAEGDFSIRVDDKFVPGLKSLEKFRYIYVLYHLHKIKNYRLIVNPPWQTDGREVGLFASRAPNRPNPLGLSVVELMKVDRNLLVISAIDAFDGTPVIDIKPYVKDLDSKEDAGRGWLSGTEDFSHLKLHLQGIPH